MDRLTPERARRILEGAQRVRALVVGDLMLDRYIVGAVDRISPEAPVPVVLVEEESAAVGGAGNVAANVAALGASCAVVGCAGRDAAGEILRATLEALGIHTDGLIPTDERPTTVKTRIVARRQQVVRVDRETEDDASPELASQLAQAVRASVAGCDVVVAEDYNKGVLVPAVIRAVLEAAAAHGIPVVVDPKRRNFFAYSGAHVLKPNAKELADALGEGLHADDAAWMEATRTRLGCANLLLTLGERGMSLQGADVGQAGAGRGRVGAHREQAYPAGLGAGPHLGPATLAGEDGDLAVLCRLAEAGRARRGAGAQGVVAEHDAVGGPGRRADQDGEQNGQAGFQVHIACPRTRFRFAGSCVAGAGRGPQ